MLRTIRTLAALYLLALLCSCQKEVSPSTPPPTDTTASGSYMPLTEGTYWIYRDSASDEDDTATVTGEKLVQNNINYTKVHLVSPTDSADSYYSVKDHNYYINGEQSGITLTMLILNDTVSVGNSWAFNMGDISTGIPGKGTGTIVEKLTTYTVQGKTFSDVIHTHYVVSATIMGTDVAFATYDFYFAKEKGIIKVKATLTDITGGGNDTESTQELIDYSIK